jgi:hypothetical protein
VCVEVALEPLARGREGVGILYFHGVSMRLCGNEFDDWFAIALIKESRQESSHMRAHGNPMNTIEDNEFTKGFTRRARPTQSLGDVS